MHIRNEETDGSLTPTRGLHGLLFVSCIHNAYSISIGNTAGHYHTLTSTFIVTLALHYKLQLRMT